jgi:hypothetical protein
VDVELLVHSHHTLRIEARIGADVGHCGRVLPPEFVELAERTGQHSLADCGGDAFADPRKAGQVASRADHLTEAIGKDANACGGAALLNACGCSSRFAGASAIIAIAKRGRLLFETSSATLRTLS